VFRRVSLAETCLVNRVRAEVHAQIYNRVAAGVTATDVAVLDALLVRPTNSTTTDFNRLKQTPGPATPTTILLWIERLDWLTGLLDPDPLLEGIAHTKLRQFAAAVAALDVGDVRDISQPGKRHTLLLALLRQARMRCRDELVEMLPQGVVGALRRGRGGRRGGLHIVMDRLEGDHQRELALQSSSHGSTSLLCKKTNAKDQ